MNETNQSIRRAVLIIIAMFLSMGCGGMETDSPVVMESGEGDGERAEEERSQPKDDNGAEERTHHREVAHPFEPNTVADDAPDETGPEISESTEPEPSDLAPSETELTELSCAPLCFKALWCHGSDDGDFGNCIAQCEDEHYLEVVDHAVLECADQAEGCGEVAACDQGIDTCLDVCGAYYECGWDADYEGCHEWCAGEFWSGRLDGESVSCVMEARESLACAELTSCGLSPRH